MMLEHLDIYMLKKKVTLDSHLQSFAEINSKPIIDLNGKLKTIKLLEENMNLWKLGLTNTSR